MPLLTADAATDEGNLGGRRQSTFQLTAEWVDWRGWCAAGLDCFAGG